MEKFQNAVIGFILVLLSIAALLLAISFAALTISMIRGW